jgi:hypothetical protein
MSSTYYYRIVGKNIELWEYVASGQYDIIGDYRIRLPVDRSSENLIYPNNAIDNGLMFEGTAYIEPFVNADPNELSGGAQPTLSAPTGAPGGASGTVDNTDEEEWHINMSRMLSLAIVDYCKAMMSDLAAKLDMKEYYMREFWKKVGDERSNKRIASVIFPHSPYAVK